MRALPWPFHKRITPASPRFASAAVPELTIEQHEALTPIVIVCDGAAEVTYCTRRRAMKCRADTLFAFFKTARSSRGVAPIAGRVSNATFCSTMYQCTR